MKTSLWFSWVIFIIAAGALCLAYVRCEPVKVEWASILVTILGVLVATLIGLQVYNAVEMRNVFNKVDKIKKELNTTNKKYKRKITSLEWLVSALHGSVFNRDSFKHDTDYFLHCLDVVGCYIKSGINSDSAPFKHSLDELEIVLNNMKTNNSEIIFMGGNKDFVREWYQTLLIQNRRILKG